MDTDACPVANKNRILLFDIWRIIAIFLIVAIHSGAAANLQWLNMAQQYNFMGGLFGLTGQFGNIGGLGVELIIILSGCTIEYTYGEKIRGKTVSFLKFIKKRVLHLYPAYWLSLLVAVVLTPSLIGIGWIEWIKTASGFWIFQTFISGVSNLQQPVNPMGWFVGVILCLYLVYPIVSEVLHSLGVIGLAMFFAISYETLNLISCIAPTGMDVYWFPLGRLFEFALGVYIVQKGLYPKSATNNSVIKLLSDLCFPVFLVHYILLPVITATPQIYYLNVIAYIIAVGAVSVSMLMFVKYFEKLPLQVTS